MKKTLKLMGLCALAMLAAVACKKNDDNAVTFKATLTQPTADSKTQIGEGNNLVWRSGDQIKVYTAENSDASAAVFTTMSDNMMTATFTGTVAESESYRAFYPTEGVTVSGGKFVLPLNAAQTFVSGNFASGAYPMFATATGETFNFHSPAGLLMLKLTGSGTVASVELTDNDGAHLAGHYEIDPSGNSVAFAGSQTKVTLTCGGGVDLQAEMPTVMYFVLPAGVFANGFTAVVKNTAGEEHTLSTTHANLIVAEKILEMPTVNVSFEPAHEYVDLGLPSGLLWATCNVGADTPEGYGDYFAWGETTPKSVYDWSNYRYSNSGDWVNPNLTKYCSNAEYGYNGFTDDLTVLLPEDDAATANWGGNWRMPTAEEFEELYDNTTVTWTQQNGVNGRLFTASNGNSLFLPAAGGSWYGEFYAVGSGGDYWSSLLRRDGPDLAWSFEFGSNDYYICDHFRSNGYPVRAVREP